MAALNFLRRNHDVTVLHFNHGTHHGQDAYQFIFNYCYDNDIEFVPGFLRADQPAGNKEEFWREHRYAFLDGFTDAPVVTCHHLDDCVETWIWSSMHGEGKIIPYRRNNVIRPFRLTRKRTFELWAATNNTPFVQDPSNEDTKYTRNYIRQHMMPNVLKVNPGIFKVITKKVNEQC